MSAGFTVNRHSPSFYRHFIRASLWKPKGGEFCRENDSAQGVSGPLFIHPEFKFYIMKQ